VAIKTKNQKQLTQANYNLNFIVNLKTTTLNTAIAVDRNKANSCN